MDQGDERLDEVFEDERDETQGWYFDLPSGAWERQEQTNRRLRETLLNRSDDDEDVQRDPFTGQPISGRKRFGLRRKKDPREETAKAPRFQKRASDEERVSSIERWRGETDSWTTEPGATDAPDDGTLLRPRNRAAEEPSEREAEPGKPRSRWEEMFGAKAGDDNLLEGMRQWARKDAEHEPQVGDEETESADDDDIPTVLRHQPDARSDARSIGDESPVQEPEFEQEESPRLLRREHEESRHEADGEPASRWEGAFGAAGSSAGGLGAWSDRAGAEEDPGDNAAATDASSSWAEVGAENTDEHSADDVAAFESGWTRAEAVDYRSAEASAGEPGDDDSFVQSLRQRAAIDLEASEELAIEEPVSRRSESRNRGLFGAMRAWFSGDSGEVHKPAVGAHDELPDEWIIAGEDDGSDVEAMRAWACGETGEQAGEPITDESAVEGGEGIDAMRAWARGDASDGLSASINRQEEAGAIGDDAEEDAGIDAMRAWARGVATDGLGASIDREEEAGAIGDDAEEDAGIDAMRAWARGDANDGLGASIDQEEEADATGGDAQEDAGIDAMRTWARGQATDDEARANERDPGLEDEDLDPRYGRSETPAGAGTAPERLVLVTREGAASAENQPAKRGIFGRLFGRKRDAGKSDVVAHHDDTLSGVEGDESIDDSLGAAGWVPVEDTRETGAPTTSEPNDFERLSAERRNVEGLADNDEPAATAELLEAEDEADALAGDWAFVPGQTDDEADGAGAELAVASAEDEDSESSSSGAASVPGATSSEADQAGAEPVVASVTGEDEESSEWAFVPGLTVDQTDEAGVQPVAPLPAEDVDADEAPWTLVELLDDAEMLEEMVEDSVEAPATAELPDAATAFEPATAGEESTWARSATADSVDAMSPEADDEEVEAFPWAAAALTEEALELEEAMLATMAKEAVETSSDDDSGAWQWAPELEDDEQPPSVVPDGVPFASSASAEDAVAAEPIPNETSRSDATLSVHVHDDEQPEAEISDEELETALYLAEAYAEEATSEFSAPGALAEAATAAELPGVDEEELLLRYGWQEDFDDEDFFPRLDELDDFGAEPLAGQPADRGADPGQMSFEFAGVPGAGIPEPTAAIAEPDDEHEMPESAFTQADDWSGRAMPRAADAPDDERTLEVHPAADSRGEEALGWEMPSDEEPDSATPAETPLAQGEDVAALAWAMPDEGDAPASETDAEPATEPEPALPASPAAPPGSLLSRYAAEVSAEPDPLPEAQATNAEAEDTKDSDEAPDLWAAIAEEAASTGEQTESLEFAHPRVYGAPGGTSSLLSFSGVRDDDGYVPDETFVAPEDESSPEDDLILRAFEAHAATEIEAEVPQEAEPDPSEFDELLGEGSQELVDEPGIGEPAGVSYARLHDWPGMTQNARDEISDSWMLADEASPPAAATMRGLGAPPPNMPYADIDRPFPRDGSDAQKQKTRTLVRELVETGLLALLVFLAVRASFQNFKVDGNSMYPTLEDGQFLIVNKLIYSEVDLERLSNFLPFVNPGEDPTRHVFHPPQRGDIVVLRDPSNPSVDLIKRVVGMPGDRLEIYEGAVYINDYLLEEPYITQQWHDTRPAVLIPDGHYFVLGDNRDNSKDSRSTSIGFIPEDLIIGRAELSYWPFSQFGRAPNDNPTISETHGRPVVTTQVIERD